MALLNPANPEFWVAVAFIVFVGLLLYLEAFKKIGQALDNRAAEIRRQLDEARRLREEAQAILDDYKRKRSEAEKEAADIIAQAKKEAEIYAKETQAAFHDMLKRRAKLAEDKIARAEMQVINEVRSKAIDAAIAAAGAMISQKLTDNAAQKLIADSIKSTGAKLN